MTTDTMTRDRAINELYTPEGKRLGVYNVKNTALYKLAFTSGGELPGELNGMFTDTTRAMRAAQTYLERRWDSKEKRESGTGK